MLTRDGTSRTRYGTGGVPINVFSYLPGGAPVNPPPTGADDAEFATNAKAQPETFSQTAFSDPDLVTEATAFKNICPRSNARYVAVRNGPWETVSTWYDTVAGTNAVPATVGADILIPQGVTVTKDTPLGSEVNTHHTRVDGRLITNVTADRRYAEEFIYVDHTGEFECGTQASPVPAGITIHFNPWNMATDMDFANDPMKLGRGFACFDGQATMYGAPKTEWARLNAGYEAGTQVVVINGAITGWEIGDRVFIPGTVRKGYATTAWEDWLSEEFTITNIDVTNPLLPEITLDRQMTNHHRAFARDATKTPHIANLTRNIRHAAPAGQTPEIWQRGHTMFKGEGGIDVSYCEFVNYGRTDHFTPDIEASGTGGIYGVIDNDPVKGGRPWNGPTFISTHGMMATTARTNFDGRYALHFHRAGINNVAQPAVHSRGCVVDGSAAWGCVHHDSYANIEWHVGIRHRSAAIAAEGGGSFGTWDFCFASDSLESWRAYNEAQTKTGHMDRGSLGHGYWLNSRIVHVQNCVGCNNNCNYLWTSRTNSAQGTAPFPNTVETPGLFYGLENIPGQTVSKSFAVIEGFLNNECYAGVFGMAVAKKAPSQHHDGRSFLDGFVAWEVETGAAFQYTAHYTLKDFELWGQDATKGNKGISIFRQSLDMSIVNPRIDGFQKGIAYTLDGGDGFRTNVMNTVVNSTMTNNDDNYTVDNVGFDLEAGDWDNLGDGLFDARYLTSAQVGPAADIVTTYVEDESVWTGNTSFMIIGNLTDRLGTRNRVLGTIQGSGGVVASTQAQRPGNQSTNNSGTVILLTTAQMEAQVKQQGTYLSAAGDRVLLIEDYVQDRFDGAFTIVRTPVAVRAGTSYFNELNGPDNGSLTGQFGGAFDSFNPVGTPGLT